MARKATSKSDTQFKNQSKALVKHSRPGTFSSYALQQGSENRDHLCVLAGLCLLNRYTGVSGTGVSVPFSTGEG
jgi:hypothetical protein